MRFRTLLIPVRSLLLAATIAVALASSFLVGLDANADEPSFSPQVSGLHFESNDFDWTDYAKGFYWVVWKQWHLQVGREAAQHAFSRELGGGTPRFRANVKVRVTLDRGGDVVDATVLSKSPIEVANRAAKNAVFGAVLPPLPAGFPRDSETVTIHLVISMTSEDEILEQARYLTSMGLLEADTPAD